MTVATAAELLKPSHQTLLVENLRGRLIIEDDQDGQFFYNSQKLARWQTA